MSFLDQYRVYNWHAVYVKYKSEKKIYEQLLEKGIECYLPLKMTKRLWSDRQKIISEPLLTSYVFVKISSKEYYDVLVIAGVVRYVCFDKVPAVITENQIHLLKLFVEHANEHIEVSSERLKKGNIVRILNGPFKDVVGEVIEQKSKKYVVLRFVELGYILQVDLGENEIELLPPDYFSKLSA